MRKLIVLALATLTLLLTAGTGTANAAPTGVATNARLGLSLCFKGIGLGCPPSADDKRDAVLKRVRTDNETARRFLIAFCAERRVSTGVVGSSYLQQRLQTVRMTKALREDAYVIMKKELDSNRAVRGIVKSVVEKYMPKGQKFSDKQMTKLAQKAANDLIDRTLRDKTLAAAVLVLWGSARPMIHADLGFAGGL